MNCADFGVFISEAKTSVSYAENSEITIAFSNDKGETWTTSSVTCDAEMTNLYIGFTSENEGWLIGCSFVGMGEESHSLYTTVNGGESWTLVDSDIAQEYSRVLVGAGFINQDIGFLCFRYESDEFSPAVMMTTDGGESWSQLSLALPDEYESYSATALSPSYDGNRCTLSVLLSSDNEGSVTVKYISDDLGETFALQS